MDGAARPDSLLMAARPVLTFGAAKAMAVLAVLAVLAVGCAAPTVPVTNVVDDGDLRECSASLFEGLGPLDVAIVIDTSQSTGRSAGFDIDLDGSIQRFHRNGTFDRGDSRLAAQVAAVRPLLRGAEGHDIRFSIVTFSGASVEKTVGRTQLIGSARDSRIRARLTNDMRALDGALDEILEIGNGGMTIFYGGMQRATRSLLESSVQTGQGEPRRKIVLFMSDTARPNSLGLAGGIENADLRMKRAALRAQSHGIVFHTFGLSPRSDGWRDKAIGQIAGATGGTYHPIEDPGRFYCHLANSLLRSQPQQRPGWQNAFEELRALRAASSKNGDTRLD